MGGAAAGDVASSLAVDTFLTVARQEMLGLQPRNAENIRHALLRAAAAANRAVRDCAAHNPSMRGMGSTLVAACVTADILTVVNVGDSRAYLLRQGKAHQLTADHSWVADQVRLGTMSAAQAERSSLQSLITRAIGAEADVLPDLYTVPIHTGDTLLLTTDGLTRHVQPQEIATLIHNSVAEPAGSVCRRLIQHALQRGGSDNVTCFVVRLSVEA